MASFAGLRKLLVIHGVITLAAAIVLAVSPGLIPRMAGVRLEANGYLLAYLLAGAEFGIAFLSFGGSRLAEPRGYASLPVPAWSFMRPLRCLKPMRPAGRSETSFWWPILRRA